MIMRLVHASTIAAIALLATGTVANAAPATENIRCFLVSNVFAKAAKDAKGQQVAAFVRFYNLGQMQAKLSTAEIKAAVVTVGKTIDQKKAADVMNGCAKALETADRSIEAIGQQVRQQVRKTGAR
jgi:NADH/NAD ratio-sensing transcriptional regulator Rex